MRIRPRRNRKSASVRNLVREYSVSVSDLIYPMFVTDGTQIASPIHSMPGICRYSTDFLLKEIEECVDLGLQAFALFPHYDERLKDRLASQSYQKDTLYLRAIAAIKDRFPHITLLTDVAMDPYSSDGHDGIFRDGKILNDETLEILGKMALAQAQAGADILGPSDMMDGRVGYIRDVLDKNGFQEVSIMSYTAKYASAFYGPFRDALDSAPKSGDKKTYQMDPANKMEALREAMLDTTEGADFIMVKPALPYLDIIHMLHAQTTLPVAAYQVSGEYAQIMAASERGWIEKEAVVHETLLSIKRAGAKIILTYFAKEFARKNKVS